MLDAPVSPPAPPAMDKPGPGVPAAARRCPPGSEAGVIVSVHGAVVDVMFSAAPGGGALPAINTELVVQWDRPEPLALEVHSHMDPRTVRAIALQPTSGLARGTLVQPTGGPVTVPVGKAVLGRLLDVVGTLRDRGPPLPADTKRRSIHNPPPALRDETSATTLFEVTHFKTAEVAVFASA